MQIQEGCISIEYDDRDFANDVLSKIMAITVLYFFRYTSGPISGNI